MKRSQENLANRVLEQDQKLQKQSEQMAKMAQSLEDLKSSRADAVRHRQEGEKLVGLAMAEIDSKAKQLDETSPVARCQTALARLLESMARLERGESPLSGDGRKGSWAATLRAASGRLLAVLRELSDDALAKYSHRATREAAETKSRRKLGNEIYHMRRGHMDDSHWTAQHAEIVDRRAQKLLGESDRPRRHSGEKGWHFQQRQEAHLRLQGRLEESAARQAQQRRLSQGRWRRDLMQSCRRGMPPLSIKDLRDSSPDESRDRTEDKPAGSSLPQFY